MPHNNHPRTLAEFGITLDQYNTIIDHPSRKATADLWFGTCCNRPIHSFVEIAKIRKLTSEAIRRHMLYVFSELKEYSDLIHERKLQHDKRQIEEDIFQISLALFRHYEMPYRSYHCNIPYLDYH